MRRENECSGAAVTRISYALADGDRCYILNPEEEESIIWDKQEVLQEEKELSKTGKYYIQSNYIEKMGCYLMSANSPDINYINSNMTHLDFIKESASLPQYMVPSRSSAFNRSPVRPS